MAANYIETTAFGPIQVAAFCLVYWRLLLQCVAIALRRHFFSQTGQVNIWPTSRRDCQDLGDECCESFGEMHRQKNPGSALLRSELLNFGARMSQTNALSLLFLTFNFYFGNFLYLASKLLISRLIGLTNDCFPNSFRLIFAIFRQLETKAHWKR